MSRLNTGVWLTQQKRLTKHLAVSVWLAVEMPSKHLLFHSAHMYHKIQARMKVQILLMDFPTFYELQLTKASLTLHGIDQCSPKSDKNMLMSAETEQ